MMRALIVGGSLAGLATGLALARAGYEVEILERSGPRPRTGGALVATFAELVGAIGREHAETVVAHTGRRDGGVPVLWSTLREGLRRAVDDDPLVTLHHGVRVTTVHDAGRSAHARAGDGRSWSADAVIGADGHRSLVRRSIAPRHPDATYAGYTLWIGEARQSQLDGASRPGGGLLMRSGGPHVLLGYPMPEPGGDALLGWAWYDPTRNGLLRERGNVIGSVVQHSMRASDAPERVLAELYREAKRHWPSPWMEAIQHSVRRRAVTGIPIAEYVPERLVSGRLAIVGNAAHVPTPMTGSGFAASLDDAAALGHALHDAGHADVPAALRVF